MNDSTNPETIRKRNKKKQETNEQRSKRLARERKLKWQKRARETEQQHEERLQSIREGRKRKKMTETNRRNINQQTRQDHEGREIEEAYVDNEDYGAQRPDSIRNLVFFFFNLTHRTNYFNNPVTPQLVAQLNTDIQTERNNNPNNLIDNPPVYNQNMADEAAITNALQTVFGNNAANLFSRGSNIAKIEPFSGKEDEDPIEWLAIFEKAAATNGWTTPERKLAVAASYLRGAASDWYDTNSATIGNHWESGQNTGNNFTDLFKKYFANDTRKNKWYQELLTLRQGSNETVDDYAAKFQRLLKRVDTTNAIPDAQKIRMFLFGLTPTITPMVHLQDANTLSDVIGNARKVETGLNYAHLGPSVTGIATKVATVSTTPAKTESPQMEAIEALTQQMQKLSLNYANLSSALLAQTQPIQPQPVRRIQPARYTQPNNLTQTFRPNRPRTDIRDIKCYRCGEKGHYARDCMSERNARRPQRRDAHYLETYEETYDSYDNYYEDEYYQDYYDDNYEEAEAYVTTRSRSQPTTNYRPKPKQPRAVENIISSESQQEQRLRRPQPRQNINIPMDEVIETTATPAVPPKRTVKRTPRMPSIIEQMPPYRISDDILNMPSSAKIGQLLKYNDQKKDFARILRRPPKTQETNYVDRISDSEEGDTRDTTAVKCAVRIKGDPVYAILDSGAAVCVITKSLARKLRLEITKPSNTIVVTADGTRNRALGQIEKVPITFEQHLDNITQVFQALRNANLKIKLKKCYFCLPSIAFLGHIVGRDGIRVDPSKIEKIRNFPAPTSVTEIRSHRAGKANANADALSRINPTEEPINSAECFLAIIGEEKNIYEVQNDGYSRPQRIPKKFNIIQPEFKPEYLINEPFWEHSQRKYRFNFFSHLY
ncbi:retroviral aspartyl protease family protein [Rhizophagus irregularis DAOM 181602=DAOM 197198]|nr:retroviral aspartyl protease family protein [Rhizophagus irregularis DAOM 181602=DAOM 197198]